MGEIESGGDSGSGVGFLMVVREEVEVWSLSVGHDSRGEEVSRTTR